MAKPRKPGGPKQKLSAKAAAAKKRRDEALAMTPERRKKKAQNQRLRRKYQSEGISVKGKDIHHGPGDKTSLVSTHANRSGFGKGTKREGELRHRRHNID